MYTLIQYDKFQSRSRSTSGEIIMEQKNNANGFLEKMIEIGFVDSVFEIQYFHNEIKYGLNIGTFEDDRLKIENDSQISAAAKRILPLLNLLNQTA